MILNGAHIFCRSLISEGVKVLFGYPGGVILPLYDTFPAYPSLRHILTRHEQGAALAADGYARVSGKVGVCLATSGPGATNLVTGIANAKMDSIPIVAITGQVHKSVVGTDAFQETDMTGVTLPITKHNYLVTDLKNLQQTIKEAFHIARSGRPGPVHIDITTNVWREEMKYKPIKNISLAGYKPSLKAEGRHIAKAISLIKKSKRPVIITGHGVLISTATKELNNFVKTLRIPVFSTLLGLSALNSNNPLFFGMLGMHGRAEANFAVYNSDLIIGIGIRFDDRIMGKMDDFAPLAKVIHIDIDAAEIGKNRDTDIGIVGDAKEVLQVFNKKIKKPLTDYRAWIKQIKHWTKKCDVICSRLKEKPKPAKLPRACDIINGIYETTNKGNCIFGVDVGQNEMWGAQYFKFHYPGQFLASGGLGAMGYCLPAAMGAKIAAPGRTVWALMGDGGIQMNIQELMTLVQDKINIKIAVLNNGYLGMIRQWQDLFFKKNYVDSPMLNPDFSKIADAYRIKSYTIKKYSEIMPVLNRAQKEKGPVLVDCQIIPDENIMPMVPAGKSIKDTMLRAGD